MTNALAIAGVTATLKDVLHDAIVASDANQMGDVDVTCKPPDQLVGDDEKNILNIYPWKVTQNAALSNDMLPARGANGARMGRNRLALDIHFIMSATGAADLNAAILLGYGMQVLHEMPHLTSAAIAAALGTGGPPADGTILTPTMRALANSNLADQIERVRITPTKSEDEDLFKLWPAFNAALRMSSLYKASLVLLEVERDVVPGPKVRSVNLGVVPIKRPKINRVDRMDGTGVVAMGALTVGDRMVVGGNGFAGEDTVLWLGGAAVPLSGDAVVGDQRIAVTIPVDTRAGLHLMQLEHRYVMGADPTPKTQETSNGYPVLIAANVQSAQVVGDEIVVTCAHSVGSGQEARLFLASDSGAVYLDAAARNADGPELRFDVTDVAAGTYRWLLNVDGAETETPVDIVVP